MRIVRIAQAEADVHTHENIVGERFYLFFRTSIDADRLEWKPSQWISLPNGFQSDYIGFVKPPGGGQISNPIYTYRLSVTFDTNRHDALFELFINGKRSRTGEGESPVATWEINANIANDAELYFHGEGMKQFFAEKFSIIDFHYPEAKPIEEIRQRNKKNLAGKVVEEGIRLTRMKDSFGSATELYIYVMKSQLGYHVAFQSNNLEDGKKGEHLKISSVDKKGASLSWEKALAIYDQNVQLAKDSKNYVDKSSPSYIPEGANSNNWDFLLNRKRNVQDLNMISPQKAPIPTDTDNEDNGEDDNGLLKDLFSHTTQRIILSQDFAGYFSGSIPEYGAGMLGSGTVDASQVKTMFSKTDDAIRLVNEFDSSLLANVSFIFNFTKGGAYGVYLSELDRVIKTQALKKELESKGYRIDTNEQGVLTAYPVRETDKTSDQIQADIDQVYQNLQSKGGSAFGINMNAVLSAARMDASQTKSSEPSIWEWMALLHLGGTIVHEAIHAKGHHDEGPSEAGEEAFMQWALPRINESYKQSLESQGHPELFAPLIIGGGKRHAKGANWYRRAQSYMPNSIVSKPQGSDLQGRFPSGLQSDTAQGIADWSKMMQLNQDTPIEKRLSREYMFPMSKDISQENDVIEEQLRKSTREIPPLDVNATTEELLYSMHDDTFGYKTTEELLEERRPKPIIIPIKKASLTKVATLFGWYNNLDLADGSTIPGLSDRVMSWEDADEDFREEEREIKRQPRYNPSYDIKGFYYRWIEPLFKPTLFDDVTRDLSNTSPAVRFASHSIDVPDDMEKIISLLSGAIRGLSKATMPSARFVMTKDLVPWLSRVFRSMDYGFKVMPLNEDDMVALWVYTKDVADRDIERAEEYLSNRYDEGMNPSMEDLVDHLMGISTRHGKSVRQVMDIAKSLCKTMKIRRLYVLGAYARSIALPSNKLVLPNAVDFSSPFPNQTIKLGWALAEKLGVDLGSIHHGRAGVSFPYQGLVLYFSGAFMPEGIKNQMEERSMSVTPLLVDIYNHDFTLNMLAYDVLNRKLCDFSGDSMKDIGKKSIRTYFEPGYICRQNPMSMLRAILLKMQYDDYDIDESLQYAIIENSRLLFSGKYTAEQLIVAREKILLLGKNKAIILLENFGLSQLLKV
ncbi:MAG: hypothetical protein WC375_04335 [Methanomassiliicoccales archaeon]|jgi:hypothetical protein